MFVERVTDIANLQKYAEEWDQLAGECLFRSPTWLLTWWHHYGAGRELFVLLVFDDGSQSTACNAVPDTCHSDSQTRRLIGILPAYVESTFPQGRVLRLLGDGEACTDHLDLVANCGMVDRVASAIAKNLLQSADEWDTSCFEAVGSDCLGLVQLGKQLSENGCHVSRTPNQNRWSIALPEDWEGFLALQSKSHRKKLRRLERAALVSNRATWQAVETAEQFAVAWPILRDLHQRRRRSLGEPGCFASPEWSGFHADVARRLLDRDQLRLSWLQLDGDPVAAEYQFASGRATFAYQGGVEPNRIDEQPGRLSLMCSIQAAISAGHQTFDLMRGDEPYKAQWRATPQPTIDIRATPPRHLALLRSRACSYLKVAVRTARQITSLLS